jgi:Domain of unknown function (DUF6438)
MKMTTFGRWQTYALAVGFLVAGGGCAARQAVGGASAQDQVAAMADMPDALIQMRRGGCAPGRCPVYGLSIFPDGTVVYDGRFNVAVTGQRRAKLAPDLLSQLVSMLDAMDFLDSAERCCICPDAKHPRIVVLDYRPGGEDKTVLHDDACDSAPPAMRQLEAAIDESAAVQRWTSAIAGIATPSNASTSSATEAPGGSGLAAQSSLPVSDSPPPVADVAETSVAAVSGTPPVPPAASP